MSILNLQRFEEALKILDFPVTNHSDQYYIYRIEDVNDSDKPINTPSFRQFFVDITLFIQVNFDFMYSHLDIPIDGNTLQICAPKQVLKVNYEPDPSITLKGYTLYLREEFLLVNFENSSFLKEFPFLSYSNLNNVVKLTNAEVNELSNLYECILYEQSNNFSYSHQVVRAYALALLYRVKRIWKRDLEKGGTLHANPNSFLISRLDNLMRENLDAKLQISNFADMMNIDPKRLAAITRQETGKTPKLLFDSLLVIEAKTLLRNTNLSISEIGYQLGFEDTSYFSKFFKRLTSVRPSQFRLREK